MKSDSCTAEQSRPVLMIALSRVCRYIIWNIVSISASMGRICYSCCGTNALWRGQNTMNDMSRCNFRVHFMVRGSSSRVSSVRHVKYFLCTLSIPGSYERAAETSECNHFGAKTSEQNFSELHKLRNTASTSIIDLHKPANLE